jgi:hypothetical protein
MAVPKKKRYKQVVKARRSLLKINTILKKNLAVTKFNNYANISKSLYCTLCKNKGMSASILCGSCYVIYFVSFFLLRVETKRQYELNRNFRQEYYDELSKAFFPSSES